MLIYNSYEGDDAFPEFIEEREGPNIIGCRNLFLVIIAFWIVIFAIAYYLFYWQTIWYSYYLLFIS